MVHTYIYIYSYIHICIIHIFIYVCTYTYIYLYFYIYICIYTYQLRTHADMVLQEAARVYPACFGGMYLKRRCIFKVHIFVYS